ncbi:DNA methyltransferase [Nostocoides australiense]
MAYLDPPYNCGYPLTAYDDTASSSEDLAWLLTALGPDARDLGQRERWLSLVYGRLLVLTELISPQGSLVISIDSCEAHTMLALGSELFGNRGTVQSFSWPHAVQPVPDDQVPVRMNYLLVIAPATREVTLPIAVLGSTFEARAELASDLGAPVQFETPKPQRLMRHLVHEHTTKHSLVLDPYAGSGSLGIAVVAANLRDGGKRRCICVERSADAMSLLIARLGGNVAW